MPEHPIENEDPGPPPEGRRHLRAVDNRPPPSDHDAEAALLGVILQRWDETWDAVAGMTEADFHWPGYQHVFGAMRHLAGRSQAIHPIAVVDELRREGLLAQVRHHNTESDTVEGAPAVHLLGVNLDVYPRQVESYAGIVARCSRSRQLLDSAFRLREAALANDLGAAMPAIDKAASAVADAGPGQSILQFEDVAAVIRGEVPDVKPELFLRSDEQGLMYLGATHWLMGEPGCGKTMIALRVVAEVLRGEGAVIYVDWEGNRRVVGSRLRAQGITAEQVLDRFFYVRAPETGPVERIQFVRTVTEHDVRLVVFDGAAKSMSRSRLNEDLATDVLQWLDKIANPVADAGAAVLILDHVGKDKEKQGMYARGSGAKIGEVTGAAWTVRKKQGFNRLRGGRVDLIQAKDREGYVAIDGDAVASITFMPADNGAKLAIQVLPPIDAGDGGGTGNRRRTHLMETVSRKLEELPEPISKTALRKIVKGKGHMIDQAVDVLVEEEYVEELPGDRKGWKVYRCASPFRADEDEGGASAEVGEVSPGHMAEDEPEDWRNF